jgi:hypothetical protein
MSPFEWFDSKRLDEYSQRRFHASLECHFDEESQTYDISLSWLSRNNLPGEIFIPAEGMKKIHKAMLDLERLGYKNIQRPQTYPP